MVMCSSQLLIRCCNLNVARFRVLQILQCSSIAAKQDRTSPRHFSTNKIPLMAPAKIVNDLALPAHVPESSQTPANTTHESRFSLEKRTLVVTGGGRGLGITLASAVLEAGGHVVCVDLLETPDPAEWTSLRKMAASRDLSLAYYRCDVTQERDLSDIFDRIASKAEEARAPLYGAIACAGIQQRQLAIDYDPIDFEKILRVNTVGVFLTAKHAARIMMEKSIKGSIVLVASMSGQIANRASSDQSSGLTFTDNLQGLHCTAYNSSKAAVQQMCRSLAQEWGPHGIRVNTLSPGYIRTAMTDQLLADEPHLEKLWMNGALLGRLGAPDDFKAPAIFMLSSGSSWMTGADLRVDGGHCATA